MADLSKLSDAELDAIIARGQKGASSAKKPAAADDLSTLSDSELDAIITQGMGPSKAEPKGIIRTVGETYDKYAAAPVRAGFNELVRTTPEFGKEKPSFFGNLVGAGKAFAGQFGEDPSLAPTGKDIAETRLGFSIRPNPTASFGAAKGGIAPETGITPQQITDTTNPSPAGFVGLGLDVGLDLGNIVPVGTIAKGVGKAGVAAGDVGKWALKNSVNAIEKTKVGKLAGAPVRSVGRIIDDVIRPTVSKDLPELTAIAEKNGISPASFPEQVEFGDESFIGRKGREIAGSSGGEPRVEKHKQFMSAVNQAFDRKLNEVGGGEILGKVDAGSHLRESFDRAADELFNKVGDSTYNKIVQTYPGLQLSDEAQQALASKLAGIEKFAQGQIKRGISDLEQSQARGLLNVVNAIRNTNGSIKQAVEELQAIGAAAYKPRNTLAAIPPDIERLRELYSTIKDGIYKTIETDVKGGDQVLGALKISNDLMSDFFGNRDAIGNILGNPRLAPEQVFSQLTANTQRIESLKNILSPEDFGKLKSAYLESLIKREADGSFSFQTLKSAMRNKSHILEAMFKPEEIQDFAELTKLGQAAGDSILNRSRTADSLKIQKWFDTLVGLAQDEVSLDVLKESARKRGLSLPPGNGGGGLPLPNSFNGINPGQGGNNYAGLSQNSGFGGSPGGGIGQAFSSEALRSQPARLKGLPDSSPGPNSAIANAAAEYARQAGINYTPATEYVKVNPKRAARIAKAYEEMPHAPNDPKVKRAYDALEKETLAQYEAIKKLGIKIEPIKPGMPNPYPEGPKQVHEDIKNGHLWFFPSDYGFGSSGADVSDNPLLKDTNEVIDGVQLKVNDIFRIVHDIFGHAKVGAGFGPRGEENAWLNHMRMYSPEAQKALTSETRGQNSWVNFGPQGEKNRANPMDTIYADQKTGLLPDWVMKEMDAAPSGPPRFGPQAIGPKEAIGLRLPQQISIQERNKNKERGR